MKIFWRDRLIHFINQPPASTVPSDLVITYESKKQLRESFELFERYEKWQRFLVIDQTSVGEYGASITDFFSLFTLVDAAGGMVKNELGEVLVIHRKGYWDLPKGKIDRGETPHLAAIREVKEETGLATLEIIRDLHPTYHIYSDSGKRMLKRTYWFEMRSESTQPMRAQISEGISLVKWTPVNSIHCILTHAYASIRELLLDVLF
jgi:ADP-ribose pyrophosphatase YjhB (NUDIX family)